MDKRLTLRDCGLGSLKAQGHCDMREVQEFHAAYGSSSVSI